MIINGIEELFMALEYGQHTEITDINLNKIITDYRFFDVCVNLPKFENVTKLSINENDFSSIEDCVERWKLLWKTIRHMPKLKILHFGDNVLVDFNLEEWEDLKLSMQLLQLEEIDLSNNNIGYFGNDSHLCIWQTIWEGIVSCEKLTKLFLRGNSIHQINTSSLNLIESLANNRLKFLQIIDLGDYVNETEGETQKVLYNILSKKSEQLKNAELRLSFSVIF